MRLSNKAIERELKAQGYELFEMRQSRCGVSLLVSYAAKKKDVAFTAPTLQALHDKVMKVLEQYERKP